jgi:hypothetical protein
MGSTVASLVPTYGSCCVCLWTMWDIGLMNKEIFFLPPSESLNQISCMCVLRLSGKEEKTKTRPLWLRVVRYMLMWYFFDSCDVIFASAIFIFDPAFFDLMWTCELIAYIFNHRKGCALRIYICVCLVWLECPKTAKVVPIFFLKPSC